MNYLILALKGIVVGMANIIPGVSGGTIAVVLKIFDELIYCVNNFTKDIKKSLKFLLPLLSGMAVGILGLGSLIGYCMEKFSFQTATFFAGLVAGSIPLIFKKATSKKSKPGYTDYSCKGSGRTRFSPANFRQSGDWLWREAVYYVAAIAAAALVVLMALLKPDEMAGANAALTPGFMFLLFIGGIIAAAAMVVPGISGSFMMVLMGLYPTLLKAITLIKDYILNPADFSPVPEILKICAPIGIGILLGVILISKIIAFLLERFYNITYFTIFGLMLGTIYGIFSDPAAYQSYPLITPAIAAAAAVTFAAGALAAVFLGKE